jgi:hypothetical protein
LARTGLCELGKENFHWSSCLQRIQFKFINALCVCCV